MVRCPGCGSLVSEWAVVCGRCGAEVGDEPLISAPAVSSRAGGRPSTPRPASPFARLSQGRLISPLVRLWRGVRLRVDQRSSRRVIAPVAVALVLVIAVTAWRTTGIIHQDMDGMPQHKIGNDVPDEGDIGEIGYEILMVLSAGNIESINGFM